MRIAFNDLARGTAAQRAELMSAIARVVDRGWFVHGPEGEAFEAEFAAYCGMPHAVGVANGTDAIELALRAIGVAAGDEVIVAPNAGLYSTTALRAIGAVPVYADVEPRHLNIDAAAAAAACTTRSKAVIATHLYGRMADVKALSDLCRRKGMALVEDCAQAHGASRDGVRAGAWGDISAFSFYPTKNLGALGDAGMVLSRDSDVAARVRRLRQYGWSTKYHAIEGPARNSRLDEVQAAVLRIMLPHLDARNGRRIAISRRYAAASNESIAAPDVDGADYVAHLYVVRSSARDALRTHLAARGIATDVHYPVLDPQQPALHGLCVMSPLPVAEKACAEILSLPCFPEMHDAEVEYVCAALTEWRQA